MRFPIRASGCVGWGHRHTDYYHMPPSHTSNFTWISVQMCKKNQLSIRIPVRILEHSVIFKCFLNLSSLKSAPQMRSCSGYPSFPHSYFQTFLVSPCQAPPLLWDLGTLHQANSFPCRFILFPEFLTFYFN